MNVVTNCKMDLIQPDSGQQIFCVQGDALSRKVALELLADGSPWVIPADVSVLISYFRPDGSCAVYTHLPDGTQAWEITHNVITLDLTPQMLTDVGVVTVQLKLIAGEEVLSTFAFQVLVRPGLSPGSAPEPTVHWLTVYLPQTAGAEPGQYLRIDQVDEQGRVMAVIGADLESRLNALEDLADRVTALEEGDGYPAAWKSTVQERIGTLQQYQEEAGRDCVSFAYFSDCENTAGHTGALIAKVMDACAMPYSFFCGDRFPNTPVMAAETMENHIRQFDVMMSPIPREMDCRTIGDLDYCRRDSSGTVTPFSPAKIYDRYFRKQYCGTRRVSGGDSSYYYVEDHPTKTRFVVMNSVLTERYTSGIVNGSNSFGFGQAQLEWLASEALSFPEEGWSVVFFAHNPVSGSDSGNLQERQIVKGILAAFMAKTYYRSSDMGESISLEADFRTAPTAQVIGWFAGHARKNSIFTENIGSYAGLTTAHRIVSVTIAPDGNARGEIPNVIDFVTVDKTSRTVHLTRLGAGQSRSFTY